MTLTFLTWSVNVRDFAWDKVGEAKQGWHAFAEIVGKADGQNRTYFFVVPFNPYLYVELPYEWERQECINWWTNLALKLKSRPPQRSKCKFWPTPIEVKLLHRERQPLHTCKPNIKCTVVKFTFDTTRNAKFFADFLTTMDPSFESRIWEHGYSTPDVLKVTMSSAIKPCEWATTSTFTRLSPMNRFTKHCEEYYVPSLDCFQPVKDGKVTLNLLSFDLEVYSESGKFPCADFKEDVIMTIGNSILTWTPGEKPVFRNVVFCLKETHDEEGKTPKDVPFECRWFSNEKDLLLAWKMFAFDQLDMDIITGYNIYQFDLPYFIKRCQLNDIELKNLGRKVDEGWVPKNTFRGSPFMAGKFPPKEFKFKDRVCLDMMVWIKKLQNTYKFKAFKLDTVAETLLNRHKIDLSPAEIFSAYRSSLPSKRYEVARYCAVDCILVLEIILNQNVHMREMAMAKVARTDIATVVVCGQQKKCFNLMMCAAYNSNYVNNYSSPTKSIIKWIQWSGGEDDHEEEKKEKYEGAVVIEPKPGFYRSPVVVLDFASKYPTEMRSHNLCFSTFLGDEKKVLEFEPYLKDVPKHEWNDAKNVRFGPDDHFRTFWKLQQDTRFVNLADKWTNLRPLILKVVNGANEWSYFSTSFTSLSGGVITDLFNARANLKKLLKEAKAKKDDLAAQIYDSDQAAVKVIMNSLYGMAGADIQKGALLPCRNVAESVTSIGREEIALTKREVEQEFKCQIIYGDTDSVFIRVPPGMGLKEAWVLGEKVAAHITNNVFRKLASLAMEKVYMPFILSNKKKIYTGAKYDGPEAKPILNSTGTISNKVNFCDVDKLIFSQMTELMVIQNDVLRAYSYLFYAFERIANNAYPLDMFLCRQKLSDKNASKGAAVRDKMRARNPGSEPQIGDMVPFVYVRSNDVKVAMKDHVEDPAFVKQNDIVLDLAFYIFNLRVQICPYFMCFPFLNIERLFSQAEHLSSLYRCNYVTFHTQKETSKQMDKLTSLVKDYFGDGVMKAWGLNVVSGFNALPRHLLPTLTLSDLWAKLELHMKGSQTKSVQLTMDMMKPTLVGEAQKTTTQATQISWTSFGKPISIMSLSSVPSKPTKRGRTK
jgi:DNA polymerase delta subunit 1